MKDAAGKRRASEHDGDHIKLPQPRSNINLSVKTDIVNSQTLHSFARFARKAEASHPSVFCVRQGGGLQIVRLELSHSEVRRYIDSDSTSVDTSRFEDYAVGSDFPF